MKHIQTSGANHDIIGSVVKFMLAADQVTEGFDVRQSALYTGLQLEETAEKIGHILGKDHPFVQRMDQYADDFKAGVFDAQLEHAFENRKELLDANFDIAWVSIGACIAEGSNINTGFAEGSRSNLAKIGSNGKMNKDENGKVKKPDTWTPPDFEPHTAEKITEK